MTNGNEGSIDAGLVIEELRAQVAGLAWDVVVARARARQAEAQVEALQQAAAEGVSST